MGAQVVRNEAVPLDHIQKTKTLICALNFVSRDLPLPTHVLQSVFSIFHPHYDPLNAGSDRPQDEVGFFSSFLRTPSLVFSFFRVFLVMGCSFLAGFLALLSKACSFFCENFRAICLCLSCDFFIFRVLM